MVAFEARTDLNPDTARLAYQQVENHVLSAVVMSRTVRINP